MSLAVTGIYSSFTGNIRYAMLCLVITEYDSLTVWLQDVASELRKKIIWSWGVILADMMNFVALPIAISCGMGLTNLHNLVIYNIHLGCYFKISLFNIHTKLSNTEKP